ncbi:S-adenosylmethionine mitochondrial carrier protein [Echinococcus granulosus]|uniref:S-adenosylmethionine mitochondrial carrier protein n=1 Tax=Echinococcus granulosus TaxID=6210 RepID=W6UHX0_ECHGR|nr:S-adenosylmethionine mitochondrial carrier protein [Echinococcus granulosus]EUB60661.1 S-adenosylmethionine mitochondrial carrier protein [Echinococcus granulosus]
MSTAFFANRDHLASLLSGATAGFCVDMAVYPIDTIKTRLQSAAHVVKPIGGRMCLFAGLPAVILGSAPGAALFFISYETVKHASLTSGVPLWMASMLSACTGDAGWWGLYRGYWSQVSRGLPFCLIQYPIWEILKRGMEHYNRRQTLGASSFDLSVGEECFPSSTESTSLSKKQFAVCGAIAGAIGGSSTTPMDVAKTRIMLAESCSAPSPDAIPPTQQEVSANLKYNYSARKADPSASYLSEPNDSYMKGTPLASGSVTVALRTIYQEGGISGLFAGLVPRVYIKAFGGAVFLGLYDISKRMWLANLPTKSFDAD